MKIFRNTSIQRKITVVTMTTCCVVLLVATGALFAFQLITFRQNFTRDLTVLGEIAAAQCGGAVTFSDDAAANEYLAALSAKPYIISAWIHGRDGAELGRYGKPVPAEISAMMPASGHRFDHGKFLLTQPMVIKGERMGVLYLLADYQSVHNELLRLYASILGLVLIVSLALAFLLSKGLQRFVSKPILRLAETATVIAERKDYSVRATKVEDDELGIFTDAFNQMLSQIQTQDAELQSAHRDLQQKVEALQHEIAERQRAEQQLEVAHKQLVDASRRAGMAEVATGVLHNVGNVLNSVNVSITLIQNRLNKSRVDNLTKTATLVKEHATDLSEFFASDPKGRIIPGYLGQLAEHLTQENRDARELLTSVVSHVEHIKRIVAMQQEFAKGGLVKETLRADTLLEDALQINNASLIRHGINIVRDYPDLPAVTVDKHKVLQILVNLIRNAKYALDESGRKDKELQLRIAHTGNGHLKLIVADNGVGIAPENLTRIFSHGFTTRKNGHGFGLHSGVLAAREMGGDLSAQSDGPGLGATFTLELPISATKESYDCTQ